MFYICTRTVNHLRALCRLRCSIHIKLLTEEGRDIVIFTEKIENVHTVAYMFWTANIISCLYVNYMENSG